MRKRKIEENAQILRAITVISHPHPHTNEAKICIRSQLYTFVCVCVSVYAGGLGMFVNTRSAHYAFVFLTMD